jgi:hypothetical protein
VGGCENRFGPVLDAKLAQYPPNVKLDRAFKHLGLTRNFLVGFPFPKHDHNFALARRELAASISPARQRTAMHLYSTGQNTLKQIAEALGVGFSTIQRDLKDFTHVGIMRPQGKGRPKGSTTRHDPVETTEPVAPQSPPPDEHDERQRRLPTAHEVTDKAEQALSQGELGEVSRAAAQVFLALADMFDGKVVVNDELIALVRSQAANWHAIADEMERQRGPKTSSRIATTKPSKRKPKAPSRKVPISEQVVHLQRSLVDYVTDWIRTGEQFLNEHPQLEEKYRYALLREAAVSAERVRLWTVEQQERAQLVAPQASHTSRGN